MQRARRAWPRRFRRMALVAALVSTAGCAQVNTDLTGLPAVELGESAFYPTLQAYAGAPIVPGNDVRILLNGDEIFPALVEAIRGARASITYAQYFFDEGPVADDVVAALADRCRAGVRAHVLLDGVGSLNMPVRYTDALREAGCEVRTFRAVRPWSLRRANNRNHRRILVVDGRVGFTGGSGVSRKWMGDGRTADHWRDTDIRVEGPAVEWMQAAFVENWLEAAGHALGGEPYFPGGRRPRGDVYAQVVRSSPEGGSYAMYSTLLIALNAARRSIRITNPYFLLDEAMTAALLERVRRGVTVEVLVPGVIDHNFVRQASRATWGRLLEAGVKIYEYRPALLHAKTMVVDRKVTYIGTFNFDPRSENLNTEAGAIIHDATLAQAVEQAMAFDMQPGNSWDAAKDTPDSYASFGKRGKARLWQLLPIKPLL